MVRRYDDPVDVRTATDGEGDLSAAPVAFVWHDRLYVVRSVLTHWYERRAWWREAAASALLGLRPEDGTLPGLAPHEAPSHQAPSHQAHSAPGALATAPAPTRAATEPAEREVWRVEAAAGRSSPVGVYDLVRDPGAGGSVAWRLARLTD